MRLSSPPPATGVMRGAARVDRAACFARFRMSDIFCARWPQMRQETYDSQMTTMSQQDSQDSQAMTAESMSQSSWAGDVNWGRGGPQTPRRNEPSRGGPQTPMADSFQAPMVPLTGLGPSPTPPRLRPPPSTPRGRTPPLGSSKPAFDKLLTVSSPSSAQGMVSVLAALRDNSNGVGVFAQEVKASIVQAVEELQQRMERKEDTGAAAREELAEAVRTIHDRVGDVSARLCSHRAPRQHRSISAAQGGSEAAFVQRVCAVF